MAAPFCPRCNGPLELVRPAPAPHWGQLICRDCGRKCGFAATPPEELHSYKLWFGRHKGRTLAEIEALDRAYLEWAASSLSIDRVRKAILDYLILRGEKINFSPRR